MATPLSLQSGPGTECNWALGWMNLPAPHTGLRPANLGWAALLGMDIDRVDSGPWGNWTMGYLGMPSGLITLTP